MNLYLNRKHTLLNPRLTQISDLKIFKLLFKDISRHTHCATITPLILIASFETAIHIIIALRAIDNVLSMLFCKIHMIVIESNTHTIVP